MPFPSATASSETQPRPRFELGSLIPFQTITLLWMTKVDHTNQIIRTRFKIYWRNFLLQTSFIVNMKKIWRRYRSGNIFTLKTTRTRILVWVDQFITFIYDLRIKCFVLFWFDPVTLCNSFILRYFNGGTAHGLGRNCQVQSILIQVYNWFEFRVFLQLDWLPYQSYRAQSGKA